MRYAMVTLPSFAAALVLSACVPDPPVTSPTAASSQAATTTKAMDGWAGLIVEVPPSLADGQATGIRVDFIIPGGPADVAGLREGDIAFKVNNKSFSSYEDSAAVDNAAKVGETIAVTFLRDGARQTVNLKYASRPADYNSPNGLWDRTLTAKMQGEEQAAREAESAGDHRAAFDHQVRASRAAWYRGVKGFGIAQTWGQTLADLAAILPKLKAAPSVSGEAERHNQKGLAILQSASSEADYDRASVEFSAAIYEVPWIADLYLNRALTDAQLGEPERAILQLRGYLILKPNATDAKSINGKIAELEALADERKPWTQLVGFKTNQTGAAFVGRLLGHKLEISVGNAVGENQKAQVGQVILTGTIHGTQFKGEVFNRPAQPNSFVSSPPDPEASIRCFGAEQRLDAEGVFEGGVFRLRMKVSSFDRQSCAVLGTKWQDHTISFSAR